MVLRCLRAPLRSHLLPIPPVVVVYNVINRRPSKATLEYVSIFFVSSSTQKMGRRQDTHSTPTAPPMESTTDNADTWLVVASFD